MHVTRKLRFGAIPLHKTQQPRTPRFSEVIKMFIFVRRCQKSRIMSMHKYAQASRGRLCHVCFPPRLLCRLNRKSGVDNQRVSHEKSTPVLVERVIIRAKMLIPKCDIIIACDSTRPPDDGFVAHIMIAWQQIQWVPQLRRLLTKTLGGPFIQVRQSRLWVHKITQMSHKIQVSAIEILDHIPKPAICKLIDLKFEIAHCFAEIDVCVPDNRIGKLKCTQIFRQFQYPPVAHLSARGTALVPSIKILTTVAVQE